LLLLTERRTPMDDLTKRQWEIVLSCADCGITDQDDQRAAIAAVEKFAAWLAAADREAPERCASCGGPDGHLGACTTWTPPVSDEQEVPDA
jgi:hypothetical protein